jgi:O-succinylhomoserine sulfhydrylase
MNNKKGVETNAIRTQVKRTEFLEHSVPLYLTSSFVFEDAEDMHSSFAEEKVRNIYSRFSNPNTSEFIEKICQMEGAEDGFAFATGMAAVFSTFAALLRSGDHILSSRSVFGSTHTIFTKIFPKWNIHTTYADVNNLQEWESLLQPNTKVIYAETPTNPAVDVIDLEWLGALAKKHNLLLIIDNCFATPYLQQPIRFGAHLSIHSGTKFIDGQGRVLGGVVVGRKDLINEVYLFSRNTGPAMSPFNAWVLSKSLETLAVRMDRHCDNALQLATYLENHPEVKWVKYPFLKSHHQHHIAVKQMSAGGGVVAFELKGGIEAGRKFLDGLKMISLSANLGDTRSIATHPASTTHGKLTEDERLAAGITPGLVRISAGLESMKDILEDIEQALRATLQ